MLPGLEAFQRNQPAIVQRYGPNFLSGQSFGYHTWHKPAGVSFIYILAQGPGGNGGNGVVGAVSTAAGGGGGGSGGLTAACFYADNLPDELFVQVGPGGSGQSTRVFVVPDNATAVPCIITANAGGNGGNGSGATAGTAGGAGSIATTANMLLIGLAIGGSWMVGGHAGVAGGTTGAASGQSVPSNGAIALGGSGGAGLGASGSAGSAGGTLTGTGLWFPNSAGGIGGSSATTPPSNGNHGFQPVTKLSYFYGGTGGGSSHGSATGAGLVGGKGGDGLNGSGGGGGGGALTGSAQGLGGRGGDSYVLIAAF